MTIEIGTKPPPAGAADTAALQQLLLDALRNGEAGAPLLKNMLAGVKLAPEHQVFVDALLASTGQSAPDDDATVVETVDCDELGELRRELADLRQANDTVAAALGACPYCWGGDRHCQVCHGRGRSGYTSPDPGLFNELVAPAVRRVRVLQQAGSRSGPGRARV